MARTYCFGDEVQLRLYQTRQHPEIGHTSGVVTSVAQPVLRVTWDQGVQLDLRPSHVRYAGRPITEAPAKGKPRPKPARVERLPEPIDVTIYICTAGTWYVQAHRPGCNAAKRLERQPMGLSNSWTIQASTREEITTDYAADFMAENDEPWTAYEGEIRWHDCLGL